MSFGPSHQVKQASTALPALSNQAIANSDNATSTGQNFLAQGAPAFTSGTNFFTTLLNGNQPNTTALLQPNIDQIRQANQAQIQALSTLAPRGGGRSGTLFGASFAPEQQIQNLFNTGRTTAATTLPQLGLAQEGAGTNLLNTGTNALNTAVGANTSLANIGLNQQQLTNALASQLGSGLFGLLTAPLSGAASGGSLLSKLGGLF